MRERATSFAEREGPANTRARAAMRGAPQTAPSSPVERILHLQRTVGNQAVRELLTANLIQAKLTIGEPGDSHEQEADRIADRVMGMPESRVADNVRGPQVQRLQRKEAGAQAPAMGPETEAKVESQTSGGRPLPAPALDSFEHRFGQDFGHVRVHTDGPAADAAQAVNARAFTLGNHIVFGAGEFAPDTVSGQRLLAHELVHVVQQGGRADGGGAIQRKAMPEADTDAPAPATTAAANAKDTVPTTWFVDFSGVANSGGKKGRADRNPNDVLILEDLTVGPKDDPKTFAKTGDALKSGYSNLGKYDHPRGPASAYGTVSYASRRDLDVKLSWDGQKKNEKNASALSAARETVEKLILHQSEVSGDWTEVERRAADAAADHLPDDSNPKVEIQWKGHHDEYSLKTVDYDVRRPSLCTAEVFVPTTTSAVDWSGSETKEHSKKDDTHTASSTHVDTDAGTSTAHTGTKSDSSQEAHKEHDKATSAEYQTQKTQTELTYGITWEDIERTSTTISTGMTTTFEKAWRKVIQKLITKTDAGDVSDDSDKDLSWTDKVKNWFVNRGKDAFGWIKNKLYNKAKSWVSGKVKSLIKKLLFVGEVAEGWWFPIVGWGIDWLIGKAADKITGKTTVDKGKDEKDPQPSTASKYTTDSTTTDELTRIVQQFSTEVSTTSETEHDVKQGFQSVYKKDEESGSGKTHEHSTDDLKAKAKSESSTDSVATQARVRTSADKSDSADTSEGDRSSVTRTYHGTTIKVTAGHPVLAVKVQEKP